MAIPLYSKLGNKLTLQIRLSEDVIVMLKELKKHYDAIDNASFISELIRSAHKKMEEEKHELTGEKA